MTDTRDVAIEFLREVSGETEPLPDDADLFDKLGIDGDDAFEFMDRFTAKFEVEADNYRWYFHHGEEGHSIGSIFFAPPNRRVSRIPITLRTLIEAIETKRWPVSYPVHDMPKVRWDIRFNQIFAALAFGGLALWLWRRFVG